MFLSIITSSFKVFTQNSLSLNLINAGLKDLILRVCGDVETRMKRFSSLSVCSHMLPDRLSKGEEVSSSQTDVVFVL